MYFYLSLQYSAIQRTVLRHDRLWSIAGMSQILSELNEIILPQIASDNGGTVIVAGGGKFTACFTDEGKANEARREIFKCISTTLPMLEFQCSEVVPADTLQNAVDFRKLDTEYAKHDPYPGLVGELNEKKRCFRGYGVTYNPHIRVCEECGEYPVVTTRHSAEGEKKLCRICDSSWAVIKVKPDKDVKELTTMQRIYKGFIEGIPDLKNAEIPFNFDDLFRESEEKGKRRIAIWASDINGMGDKVPVWLGTDGWLRKSDNKRMSIADTFDEIKIVNVEIIVDALKDTFKEARLVEKKGKQYMPFRLVVAGGDDLCIVMRDDFILDFAENFSRCLHEKIDKIEEDGIHPLSKKWLEEHADLAKMKKEDGSPVNEKFKPHSFGGAFIVTSAHTPFRKLHNTVEDLLKEAKEKSDRKDNCITWRVLSMDAEEKGLVFEKPLYIDVKPLLMNGDIKDAERHLLFTDYLDKVEAYKKLSGSHRHQIASKMIEYEIKYKNDYAEKLETWLKRRPAAREKDSPISKLLLDKDLREGQNPKGKLLPQRIATLLELMSI